MSRKPRREPPKPGDQVGRLSAVKTERDPERGQTRVVALCACGGETSILFRNWGRAKSCGCFQKETASKTHKRHGMSDTRLHRVWRGMRDRCNNPNKDGYENYGGRGVYVCEEWDDFANFESWARENGYEKHLDIDRIDNDGPYSPENCAWVTRSENLRHNRASRQVTAFGETKVLVEWSEDERCRVTYRTLASRLRRDWGAEDAISIPPGHWNPKRRR